MAITTPAKRRLLRTAALVGASSLLLAACTGGEAEPEESATSTASGEVDLAGTTVSISVPATEAGTNPYIAIAEQYMAEFPDRTVEVTELPGDSYANSVRTQLQAGNAADIIYVTPGGGNPQSMIPFAEAGFLEPLTGTSAESTVPETSRGLFSVDGEIYAQGLDLTVVTAVVNESARTADGYEFPDDFAGLLDSCAGPAADGKSVYVIAGTAVPNTGLTSMLLAASRVYVDDPDWNDKRMAGEVTFAGTQGWHDTLQAIIDLDEAGCFQEGAAGGDFGSITGGLGQGTSYAAFIPAGAASQLSEETGSEFVLAAVPGVTAESTTIYASVNNALSVTADSENKDAALAYLDWLAQPANTEAYADLAGLLPVTGVDVANLPDAYLPIADYLESGNYYPLPNQGWESGEVYNALGTGVQGLLTGQTTVEAVLEAMDAAY